MTGGDTYASDDIGGVKFPRSKLIYGADGVNSGDVAIDNPLPVQVPSGITLNAPSGMRVTVPSLLAVSVPSFMSVGQATAIREVVAPSGLRVTVPSLVNVGLATAIMQVVAPSGLAVSGNLSASIGSGTFVGVTASGLPVTPSNPLAVAVPSQLSVAVPSLVNVGLATAISQVVAPSGLRAIVPSLFSVGFQTGIMQVVAPSGLAVTGNLSASIGTGTFVGLTASGLPVASGNPLPVVVVSGGDGSVQGVNAHDSPVTADPLTIGGYASLQAPAAVSADGDAARAWFSPQGVQYVAIATPSGVPFGAFPVAQATGAPWNVFARQATGLSWPVDQATGTSFRVNPQSSEVHGFNPTGGPFLQGLQAQGAPPVPVASGAVVRALADTNGKQVVMPGAPISFRVQGVAGLLGTGSRQLVAAQGSGFSIAVTSLSVMNGSPTYMSDVVIHDGTATLYAGSAYERGGGFASDGGQYPLFVTNSNAALQAVALATGAACVVNVAGYRVNNP